jgi:Domain of unknown function (DUF397)
VAAEGPDVLMWRHSSFCNGGSCVDIAIQGDIVAVRASSSQDGCVLIFPAGSWQEFVAEIKSGNLI